MMRTMTAAHFNPKPKAITIMTKITATQDEIQKAFDLWYDEAERHPENFGGDTSNASGALIHYLERARSGEEVAEQ